MNYIIAGADFSSIPFLLLILVSVVHLNKHEKKYTYYLISVTSLILFCISDGVAYLMDELGGNYSLHFYSNLFSYIGSDIILPAFVYYVSEEIRESMTFPKIHARIVLVLCAVDMWIKVIGAYTGMLFVVTDQGISLGPLSDYVGVVQLFVSAYFIVLIYIYRKSLKKNHIVTLGLYFIIPFLFLAIELVFSGMEFMYLISTVVMMIVYVVVVQNNLQTTAISEQIMRKVSITDNLTGIFNRRAYSETIAKLTNLYPAEFVYMSLDVNGLKMVNDTLGHAAGDEIIIGASECMSKCLGIYGNIFRTGGDEFVAILYVPADKFETMISNFKNEVDNWKGKVANSLSVSFGYVKADEIQGQSIENVSILSDKRMYEAKAAFYRKKGVDRRGQIDAHTALCNQYTKILKINITSDTYQIVSMDENEKTADKGFADTISGWLKGFANSGQVHKLNLEEYLRKTDLCFLRDYFNQKKSKISIFYRRKYSDGYKNVIMEMIPTGNYTADNQELFLYVKPIDV